MLSATPVMQVMQDPDDRRPSLELTPEQASGSDGSAPAPPRYCCACGGALVSRFVPEEEQQRLVCAACARVHYRNPIPVANVIIERGDGATLLLRRQRPPRVGAWSFPGGFVELGETAEQAARRETLEEVGVRVRLGALVGVYSRPAPGVVVIVYRGSVASGEPVAGHEAMEVAWFARDAIPWAELAFDTTVEALRAWTTLEPLSATLPAAEREAGDDDD